MDAAFLQARIDKLKLLIVAYEDAITAIVTGGAESYTLDTGQSRQTVTKLDINRLNNIWNSLLNQLVVLEARQTGNGVSIGRSAY